jgi:hypothetical protein
MCFLKIFCCNFNKTQISEATNKEIFEQQKIVEDKVLVTSHVDFIYIYIYIYIYMIFILYLLTGNKILYTRPRDGLLRPKNVALSYIIKLVMLAMF